MKTRIKEPVTGGKEEIVATFGDARLVRVNGRLHLCGGSMSDRAEALEWLSAVMPEAAVCLDR